MKTPAFLEFVRLVVAGDVTRASHRLSATPGLATMAAPLGATRQEVYKGFGHGITKPRAMRAVMEHNLAWFNHYLWGDPKPDLAALRLPPKDSSAVK